MKASHQALRAISLWAIAFAIISQLALLGETILDKGGFARVLGGRFTLTLSLTALALLPIVALEWIFAFKRRVAFLTEGVRKLQLAALSVTGALLLFSFFALPYFEADPRIAHEALRLAGRTLAQAALSLLFFSALSLSLYQSIEASAYPSAAKLRAGLALIVSALIFLLSASAIIALISGGPLFPN